MLAKNKFLNILHFLLYIVVILLILFICFNLNQSFDGYRTRTINGSYVHLKEKVILTFFDDHVEVIDYNKSINYNYTLDKGKVMIGNNEYVVFKNGILDEENNLYYIKVPGVYSLDEN